MSDEVWVLDFEAEGPEPGDYVGYQSVHRTRDGASNRLLERLADVDVDVAEVEALGGAQADDGSYAGELDADGMTISYGVHRMPIED
ncbi:hypothetical protein TM4_39 [Mycobacterium phage TM4]|uniref:Uncharacterized protein n=1 Tax=Mycobacterium phage TM4 TaxID=88870 RepID=Q9ZX39_BPMT4|nr:hypothetical protein TM4_gp39 [Mycobacterium phage TM4]AAD17606.1 hypothetical protein TM4_39 [Mycobacterium phage TM4]AGK85722.1 hypothetical protein 33D_0040 [Mycobacterium phage 33D]